MKGVAVEFITSVCSDLFDLFYPPECMLCGKVEPSVNGLCKECLDTVQYIQANRCKKCGLPLGPFSGEVPTCHHCEKTHYYFTCTYAACTYTHPVREVLHLLKYQRNFFTVHVLKVIMQRAVNNLNITNNYNRVVCVPMTAAAYLKRGFNQSTIIGKKMASMLHTQFSRVLKKNRSTPSQVSLPRVERKKNLLDAFSCKKDCVEGEHLLLVDDVFTTGSTLSEAAKTLKQTGGAKKVDTFVIAR